jgi:uncharacterized protein (DUF1015 family)
MATIKPLAALRPKPELASQICELPYDVMSSREAQAMAANRPLSFLRVSKPEIELPAATDPYDPVVYETGRANFQRLISEGALRQDAQPCFYLYRQVMGRHSQVGLVAVASCAEYRQGIIRRHELTRPDKEDDRVRHIEALQAQTGPVFLVYPATPLLGALVEARIATPAEVDFVAGDGVRHTAWTIADPESLRAIEHEFTRIPSLYIADGHHRCAAAARVCEAQNGAGSSGRFLAVLFPASQVQILPYNRVLKDLNELSPGALWQSLERVFTIKLSGVAAPRAKHEVSFYSERQWYSLKFRAELTAATDALGSLDVALLQDHVLGPVFGIDDPRTSQRIRFVGGIRGPAALEEQVDSGGSACAFSLFPTSIQDLMAVADAGGLMPPKSTWFEPKLRDGMFCHLL